MDFLDNRFRWTLLAALFAALVALAGCDGEASTSQSDSSSSDSSSDSSSSSSSSTSGTGVTLQSASYESTALTALVAAGEVTDFQFCITQIKLTDDSGAAVDDGSGTGTIEAILGLVDVSDPSVAATWGTLDLPVGYSLSQLDVEVHQDAENCAGAEFSLSFNGTPLNQDLEFRFVFTPAISLDGGETLTLALDNIASAILDAEANGALNDQDITTYLEGVEGGGEEEPEDSTDTTSTDPAAVAF